MNGVDTRTGARAFTLDDLVGLAWSGRIRVPHFQRGFRWSRADVVQLVDSIHRGYPIGSLLLWERRADPARIALGGLTIDAPASENALWVVDGQQRITTLANALHPRGRHDPHFAVGYDLRGDRIVPMPTGDDPFVLPLPVAFDLTRVLTWFAERPEAAEFQTRAFDLARDLRQYAIPAYQVVQDDVAVLQDIFDRMNNAGKRMSRAEVFSALNAGTGEEDEDLVTIDGIGADVDLRLGFGRIDHDTVLQCILARRGPDIQREIRVEFDPARRRGVADFPEESRESAFAEGARALTAAVEFLISTGVPHFTLLPYKYLLVVLTRMLALHPDLTPPHRRLLTRWFWRAAVAGPGVFKGSTTGATRTLCGKVDRADAQRSLTDLLDAVGPEPSLPDARRFKTNEAAAKITLCCWWSRAPRRPDTGDPCTLEELSSALQDRPTAADAVRSVFPARLVPVKQRLWAANRVLLPVLDESVPWAVGWFQRRPLDVPADRWSDVLESHAIYDEQREHLVDEDVTAFLEHRQRVLTEDLQRFLKLRCEWGFENTPPLEDLFLDDLLDDDGAA